MNTLWMANRIQRLVYFTFSFVFSFFSSSCIISLHSRSAGGPCHFQATQNKNNPTKQTLEQWKRNVISLLQVNCDWMTNKVEQCKAEAGLFHFIYCGLWIGQSYCYYDFDWFRARVPNLGKWTTLRKRKNLQKIDCTKGVPKLKRRRTRTQHLVSQILQKKKYFPKFNSLCQRGRGLLSRSRDENWENEKGSSSQLN